MAYIIICKVELAYLLFYRLNNLKIAPVFILLKKGIFGNSSIISIAIIIFVNGGVNS